LYESIVAKVAATFSACRVTNVNWSHFSVSKSLFGKYQEARWGSSEWVHYWALPPQFEILHSNIAESTNSIIELTRNGTWLDTIETIVDKICKHISTLQEESKGEKGIFASMAHVIQQ
jgi:hypothetical protein